MAQANEIGEFIAADWGTTRRRAMRIDNRTMQPDEIDEGAGMSGLRPGDYAGECAAIRRRFGDLPILAAGMVGSRSGWSETRYLTAPVGLDDLAGQLHHVPGQRVAIVPGVARRDRGRSDVMRGEEVQALGAVAAGMAPSDALICQPGTHNKWITMHSGQITELLDGDDRRTVRDAPAERHARRRDDRRRL